MYYRDLPYFRSQLFHIRNFRVTIFSFTRDLASVYYSYTKHEIFVLEYFRQLAQDENILTLKIRQITVYIKYTVCDYIAIDSGTCTPLGRKYWQY